MFRLAALCKQAAARSHRPRDLVPPRNGRTSAAHPGIAAGQGRGPYGLAVGAGCSGAPKVGAPVGAGLAGVTVV